MAGPTNYKVSKSVIITPSRRSLKDSIKNEIVGEETEIVANISIPKDGGSAWIILCGAFLNFFIVDGTCFSFGSLVGNMAKDLNTTVASVSLINSIAVSTYFLSGPFVSSLCNRFGFRACSMIGSYVGVCSCFIAFWGRSLVFMCFFQGFCLGFSFSLIGFSSSLVIGFNFEKFRAVASGIGAAGSSLGMMTYSLVLQKLVNIDSWRVMVLLESAILGMVFFFAMTYVPLETVAVRKTEGDMTICKTITYLPTISQKSVLSTKSRYDPQKEASQATIHATAIEKVFGAAGNVNYPPSIAVVTGDDVYKQLPKESTKSRLTGTYEVTTYGNEPSRIQTNELYKMKSGVSFRSERDYSDNVTKTDKMETKKDKTIQNPVEVKKNNKSWWKKCFQWTPEVAESRPLYRDDAFFHANLEKLPEYEKSYRNVGDQSKGGIEYTLEVTRAAAAEDLENNRGLLTTAMRRVLATMLDLQLFKSTSFLFYGFGAMLFYAGFSVPFVFLPTWALKQGIDKANADIFVSTIAFSNIFGKIIVSALASKYNGLLLTSVSQIVCGLALCAMGFRSSLPVLYTICVITGLGLAAFPTLRCVVLVQLFGLEKLSNGMGLVLLFQGVGSLVGTPLAGLLMSQVSYNTGFWFAGGVIILSGLSSTISLSRSRYEKQK